MNALKTAAIEVWGLFVEDGSLAIGIVVWLLIAAFVFPHLPGGVAWRAPALFAGLVILLCANVRRAVRK